jgi:uncharacterized protein (TIRG00374 family)
MKGWARLLRWLFWLAVLSTVAVVGASNWRTIEQALESMTRARWRWLLPALAAIGLVYLCRALVYAVPLKLLAYHFPRRFLWSTAIVATSLHQLFPTAGLSGYAFITYALHQRGVRGGQASLIALVDTLSYAVATASLVIGSLVYLTLAGTFQPRTVALALAPGVGLVAVAGWLYAVQRDRERFSTLVMRLGRRLAALVHARWPEAPVTAFLEEYYKAKAVIARKRAAFLRMVGLQYLAVCCDAAALSLAFLSLGLMPKPWIVFMGFVVTMAAGALVSAPAGGGSFELVMSAFFVRHGVEGAQAVAAALLYRLVAFWIPVSVSALLLFGFRRRRIEIRRARTRRLA